MYDKHYCEVKKMRLKTILFSAAFTAVSGVAWAQTPPPAGDAPPPPPAPMAQDGDMPPPAPHMMGGRMGHGEPKSPQAGFHIQTGDETGLKVECGDLPMAECIQAAQPLIDMTSN
ncbi:hypothetical protein [Paracoccus marcusii]|uniref:hypothetical protein n=2 Tax=Paracoccus TaxID=265 RepID=UPI001C3D9F25|nr:hypothetical protein [Paracoccus marcusii]